MKEIQIEKISVTEEENMLIGPVEDQLKSNDRIEQRRDNVTDLHNKMNV